MPDGGGKPDSTPPDAGAPTGARAAERLPMREFLKVVWGTPTVLILMGVARLGFVTELISKPIRYGYMNGIALTVLISQLPALFGFSIEDSTEFLLDITLLPDEMRDEA